MVSTRWASSAIVALLAFTLSAQTLEREVAVTFDDLPGPASSAHLVRTIRKEKLPAIGFVNEGKLDSKEEHRWLERWLAAGFDLGNHTSGHVDLHRVDVQQFEEDIVRGEKETRALLSRRGRTLQWFRHPFLHTGRTLETRDRVHRFLADRGYRVAPVTLDNAEWIFAAAYRRTNDKATRRRIGVEYVAYMDRKLAYFERQSIALFGRNIRHVLLLHANELNADWFDELARSMRTRGYRFITLERALEDPAYRSDDTFTGRGGISWLHRWAITAGRKGEFFAGEPSAAKWVLDLAGVESE
ncbi:MAG TPA: polysaccharide deacetylase family protein [Thermoanaerobaculia bacterium]|nr:polysaccharide deacetylase family protein [Thermoanaerobaculia bacterium]